MISKNQYRHYCGHYVTYEGSTIDTLYRYIHIDPMELLQRLFVHTQELCTSTFFKLKNRISLCYIIKMTLGAPNGARLHSLFDFFRFFASC